MAKTKQKQSNRFLGRIRESCKGYETLREMVGRLVLKPPRRVEDNAPYHGIDSVYSPVSPSGTIRGCALL